MVVVLGNQSHQRRLGQRQSGTDGDGTIWIDLAHFSTCILLRHAAGYVQYEHEVIGWQGVFCDFNRAIEGLRAIVDDGDLCVGTSRICRIGNSGCAAVVVCSRAVINVVVEHVGEVAQTSTCHVHGHDTRVHGAHHMLNADVASAAIQVAHATVGDAANVGNRRCTRIIGKQVACYGIDATTRSVGKCTLVYRDEVVASCVSRDVDSCSARLAIFIGNRVGEASNASG